MYRIAPSSQFKSDLRKCDRRGLPRDEINQVVLDLQQGRVLDKKHPDHPLQGSRKGQRDCHIRPDWILIYRIDEKSNLIELLRTGSHSDLL